MLFENPISKEEAHKATIERAGSMGSALNAIFYLKIANVILTPIRAITLMTAAYAVGGSLFQNSGSVLNNVLSITGIIIALAIGVLFIIMGKHYNDLTVAGACFIAATLCQAAHSRITLILYIIAAVIYSIKYTSAMSESLAGISNSCSKGWDMLLTAYKIIYISMLVCAFLIFLPPLRIIVLLIAILAVVASFAFAIYELFLLKVSANSMIRYGRQRFSPNNLSKVDGAS